MKELLVIGYVLAAVLTLIPFVRLLVRSASTLRGLKRQAKERGHEGMTVGDVTEAFGPNRTARLRKERNGVVFDLVFVSVGLVIATGLDIFQVLTAD